MPFDSQAAQPSSLENGSIDPANSLSLIITPAQMRGLDSQLKIVDAGELAESLTEAGLNSAQVEALRQEDLSLETYMSLSQLEVACLKKQGIDARDPQIETYEYGLQQPSYSYPAEVSGLTEGELAYKAVSCQNQFTGAYQALYAAAMLPSAEERKERDIIAANKFLTCALGLGVETPIDFVKNQSDFEVFWTWFQTPDADIACTYAP